MHLAPQPRPRNPLPGPQACVPGEGSGLPPTPRPGRPGAGREPGRVRILVVDDEEHVREAIASFLELRGYGVTAVGDLAAAAEALDAAPDLLLCDVVLPNVSGLLFVREVRRRYPGLPIILMSGYATEALRQEASQLGIVTFLSKPFALAALDEALRTLLGPPGPA